MNTNGNGNIRRRCNSIDSNDRKRANSIASYESETYLKWKEDYAKKLTDRERQQQELAKLAVNQGSRERDVLIERSQKKRQQHHEHALNNEKNLSLWNSDDNIWNSISILIDSNPFNYENKVRMRLLIEDLSNTNFRMSTNINAGEPK